MDIVLVTVTLASLAIAIAMGVVTWRALRLKRQSADESAGASLPEGRDRAIDGRQDWAQSPIQPEVASTPAEECRWPERQIRSRAALPLRPAVRAGLSPGDEPQAGRSDYADRARAAAIHATLSPHLPRVHPSAHPIDIGRRVVLAFGIGTVAVMVIGSSVIALSHRAARAQHLSEATTALELVSLNHAREGGQLAIRGVVRNPADGDALSGVSAVVLLFDRHDAFLGAREGSVLKKVLPPGTESPFEVVLPDGGLVTRYRVGFRSGTHPVPHSDRRSSPGSSQANSRSVSAGLLTAHVRFPLH